MSEQPNQRVELSDEQAERILARYGERYSAIAANPMGENRSQRRARRHRPRFVAEQEAAFKLKHGRVSA